MMELGIKIRTHLYKPARKTIISMETFFYLLLVVAFKSCTDKWHRSSKVGSLISLIFFSASRKLNEQRFWKNDLKLCTQGTFCSEIKKNFLLIEAVK